MAKVAVEVVYRGIFQKSLARNICRGIVLAASKEGKVGTSFGRYGDSPERNGIPAKQFAVVADSQEELEENLAMYEPEDVDVTVAVDDTLCKGVESWGWYGLQPINQLTKDNGTLLVTSTQGRGDLVQDIHQKDAPYQIGVVKGSVSFSGLWVYKDDHTDVRLLGALAKVAPHIVSLDAMLEAIRDQWKDDLKVASAKSAYEATEATPVGADQGSDEVPFSFDLPGWTKMEEGLVIRGMDAQQQDVPGREI
jgi:pyruvate ferredoxin oxidoreductase delta subunit